jgi:hypothetical protein
MKTSSSFCTLALLSVLLPASFLACSDDKAKVATDGGPLADGSADKPANTDGPAPAIPTLGAEIDRMGRPAINTALNHTFDTVDATKNAAKDAWNANATPSTWVATFMPEVEKNLAILDAIDATCGNQLFADTTKTDASRYAKLAGVLADDRLWVNTAATACTTYLAVEANATGVVVNADCGGRMPSYDVIDVTYSAAAIGALSGVTDGVAVPARAQVATFPYTAAPQ